MMNFCCILLILLSACSLRSFYEPKPIFLSSLRTLLTDLLAFDPAISFFAGRFACFLILQSFYLLTYLIQRFVSILIAQQYHPN